MQGKRLKYFKNNTMTMQSHILCNLWWPDYHITNQNGFFCILEIAKIKLDSLKYRSTHIFLEIFEYINYYYSRFCSCVLIWLLRCHWYISIFFRETNLRKLRIANVYNKLQLSLHLCRRMFLLGRPYNFCFRTFWHI